MNVLYYDIKNDNNFLEKVLKNYKYNLVCCDKKEICYNLIEKETFDVFFINVTTVPILNIIIIIQKIRFSLVLSENKKNIPIVIIKQFTLPDQYFLFDLGINDIIYNDEKSIKKIIKKYEKI